MGVRGLTTYIYNNSNKYFDSHKLHNCDIVIDGYSLATILFYNSITNTAAFGGDYDKYAKAIENFFNELLKCKVNPYVIFDGGYEKKKLHTVFKRNREKVLCLYNLGPTSHSKVCFPLMMRQVFRDKLREMKIRFAQSDFEADREIAALARKLQCPVLSNDSDFFIFDVLFITIHDFSLRAVKDDNGDLYMSCLIYNVEKFLKSLGGLPKTHLPLLAALLGNDYISSNTFANFYSQMKISRGGKRSQIHNRVQAIISWLKKESFESALRKILCHLKKYRQKFIALKVARIIQDYCQVSTPLDLYLMKNETSNDDIEIISVKDILHQYDVIDESSQNLNDSSNYPSTESLSDGTKSSLSSDEEVCSDKNEISDSKKPKSSYCNSVNYEDLPEKQQTIPNWLIDYSRAGNIPSCILTLLSLKLYFCTPQVEDYESNHAGEIGIPIISRIAGILLGDDSYSYYSRTTKCKYSCSKLPTVTSCGNKKFPLVTVLEQLNNSQKKSLFTDIFETDLQTVEIINQFPDMWHLFIFSFIFWARNMKQIHFQCYFLHAVITMVICIRIVESKIGYFRNKRPFMQRYAFEIKKYNKCKNFATDFESKNLNQLLELIPLHECLTAFEIFLPYFQTEEKLKTNAKFFSRGIIHGLSQFQVCMDLAYNLNYLLMQPYDFLPVFNFYNSTFLYNFCSNFKKRTNIVAYVETLLAECPTIVFTYKRMLDLFNSVIKITEKRDTVKKRRRRKNNFKKSEDILPEEEIVDDSSYSDQDNTFSLLSKLTLK